jgi:hypothetical protein
MYPSGRIKRIVTKSVIISAATFFERFSESLLKLPKVEMQIKRDRKR